MFEQVLLKYPNAKQSATGLVYDIVNYGEGDKPVLGSKMGLHYKGTTRSDGKKLFFHNINFVYLFPKTFCFVWYLKNYCAQI